MTDTPQALKYRLVLELTELTPAITTNDPAVADSTRTETASRVTRRVIDADSLTELKTGIANFRNTIQ